MSALRPLRRAAALGVVLLLAGCGARGGGFPSRPAPELLPPGSPLLSLSLPERDAWLRHHLMRGEHEEAARLLRRGARTAPRDALLRDLQLGVVLHAAGRHGESNAALERAERAAEDRYTKSLRRAAASLLVNDGMLAYLPSPSERAMIPYYRMLNYLALGSTAEALVEARRVSALLAAREGEECPDEGFLQYLSGLVYQAAGERNDALVSFRRSERAYDACPGAGAAPPLLLGADLWRAAREAGVPEVADSAASRYSLSPGTDAEAGDLVLVVEHGWVAHRAERDLHVPIFPAEVEGVERDDAEGVAAAAARISARLLESRVAAARWEDGWDHPPLRGWADALSGAYVVKLAWPVHRLEAGPPAEVRVLVDDSVVAAPVVEEISPDVVREYEARRALILTRAVARGITKYLAARELEERAEEKGGEVAGWMAGRLANLAANALEEADTRSWSLLPDHISLARVSLPPGEHRLRVEVGDAHALDLGVVAVPPGGRVFRSVRVWGTVPGGPGRPAP